MRTEKRLKVMKIFHCISILFLLGAFATLYFGLAVSRDAWNFAGLFMLLAFGIAGVSASGIFALTPYPKGDALLRTLEERRKQKEK